MSPVSGRLVAFNHQLVEAPRLMNDDPYERGWAIELELTDIDADIEVLMDCRQYFDLARARMQGGPRSCPCTRQGALYRRPGS
jgi:glycine cleavage system H protein